MNYQSLLKKDYKSTSLVIEKWSKPQLSYLRILIFGISFILLSIIIILSLNSNTSAPQLNPASNTSNKQRINLPLKLESIDKINAESIKLMQKSNRLAVPATLTTTATIVDNVRWLEITIKSGDSLARIFQRANLSATTLHKIISLNNATLSLKKLQLGQRIKLLIAKNGQLQELIYFKDKLNSLHIKKLNANYQASSVQKTISSQISYANVTITNSLFESGITAGLSETLIMSVANIFGWDIDFALDIRSGDQFNIVYQEHYLNGEKIRDGAILVAEFINHKKLFRAVRYTDKKNRTDYYTPDGLSMRKKFLRTPVDFKRISSRFGKRRHPVLNRMRLHKGVDYAASRGTPIRASGDGKVIYKRRKGGYGRTVIIKHGGKYSTLYAHLQSYKKGLYVGKKIKQGQIIAYVGSSGRTTGPHLHYEFRVNGVHRNPLTIKLPKAKPIAKKYKLDYLNYAKKMMVQLENYNPVNVALK